MRILVISDTHGCEMDLPEVLRKARPIDALIHCGDMEGGEERIRQMAGCPCCFVRGNNDFFTDHEMEVVYTLENCRILVTHGHWYGVSMSMEHLKKAAREQNVQVVLFGHTHRPYAQESDGILFLNPGSLSFPRQPGRYPTYLLLEIDQEGHVQYCEKCLK